MCINLELIKELYYDARPNKSQDIIMASSSCFCKRNLKKLNLSWCVLYIELLDRVIFVILRLLSPKILHTGECAQLCVIQEQHGIETDTVLSSAYGIPVHIWCFASWELRCATDTPEVRCCVHACVCLILYRNYVC